MQTVTDRDVRSQINGGLPRLDSPAVPARARARVNDTKRDVKPPGSKSPRRGSGPGGWWVWTARPASFRDTWAASGVDRTRIPANNGLLHVLWQVSNWTDRLIMFGLILALPTAATGPLRWCATRPTRRYALYATATAFIAACLIGAH